MASNVFEAITAVMADVAYVKKEGTMQGAQRYTFARAEDMVAALREPMVKHGLCLVPDGFDMLHNEPFETSGGKHMNRVILLAHYKLTHGPSKTECPVSAVGEGSDTGDKACNKAMTVANKYALKLAFQIETGDDDPDKHASADQERAALPPKTNGHATVDPFDGSTRYASAMSAIAKAKTPGELKTLRGIVEQRQAEKVFDVKQVNELMRQADMRQRGIEMMEKAPA